MTKRSWTYPERLWAERLREAHLREVARLEAEALAEAVREESDRALERDIELSEKLELAKGSK